MNTPRKRPSRKQIKDFEDTKKKILNDPLLKYVQVVAMEHAERVQEIMKELKPTFEQITNTYKQLQESKEPHFTYYRPTGLLILDELRGLNKKLSTRTSSEKPDAILITYDAENSSLDRTIGNKTFSYDLLADGKRKNYLRF